MPERTLIMLMGLPRSGKSTWAQRQGVPIVNPDAIRLALHGQAFIIEAEPIVWMTAKYMVRALFLAGHESVILDATNTTRSRRDEWKSSLWNREVMLFDTPEDECIRRAKDGGREDLIPIIEKMNEGFEDLDLADEGIKLHPGDPVITYGGSS